jgi:hypothetical protein
MLGERVPDNPTLAISLATTISRIKYLKYENFITNQKKKVTTYREMTKPSVEQLIIFQVQGSTEFKSQPFIAPISSLISLFTAINAATEFRNPQSKKKIEMKHKLIVTNLHGSAMLDHFELKMEFEGHTFIVNTFWRKKSISSLS